MSTLAYLTDHEDAVALWQAGWPHASRPSLQKRLQSIGGPDNAPPTIVTAGFNDLLEDYNSMIHGDPRSASSGAVLLPDGTTGYTITKDLASPRRADEICTHAATFSMVLTVRCHDLFPQPA